MSKDGPGLRPKHNLSVVVIALAFAFTGFMIARQVALDAKPKNAAQTSACAVAACVALKAEAADPDTLTIKVGDSVQFNSADGQSHSLSLGLGGEGHQHTGPFSSGEFQADEAWRVQFNQPGTYKFHDHKNPKINILVVTYQPGAEHKIPTESF